MKTHIFDNLNLIGCYDLNAKNFVNFLLAWCRYFFAISRETGEEYGEDYDKEVFPLARLN